MIKKPKKPLQATNVLMHGDPLSRYDEKQKIYLTNMFVELSKEAKSTDTICMLVYMAEKYHPSFKNKETRGAKLKWSPPLKAMLTITVDDMVSKEQNKKSALHKLTSHPDWKKMIKSESSDGWEALNRASKDGKKDKNIYKCMKAIHEKIEDWDKFVSIMIKKSISQD